MKKLKVIVGVMLGVVFAGAVGAALWIGPRNVVGMLRYDTRREGALKVGELAPDVELRVLPEGEGTPGREAKVARLREQLTGRPLVLIFGSFT